MLIMYVTNYCYNGHSKTCVNVFGIKTKKLGYMEVGSPCRTLGNATNGSMVVAETSNGEWLHVFGSCQVQIMPGIDIVCSDMLLRLITLY